MRYVTARASMGDTAFATCRLGYWLEPGVFASSVVCDESGNWIPDPSCQRVTCIEPEILEFAEIFHKDAPVRGGQSFIFDEVIDYRCIVGYWVTPGVKIVSLRPRLHVFLGVISWRNVR